MPPASRRPALLPVNASNAKEWAQASRREARRGNVPAVDDGHTRVTVFWCGTRDGRHRGEICANGHPKASAAVTLASSLSWPNGTFLDAVFWLWEFVCSQITWFMANAVLAPFRAGASTGSGDTGYPHL
jgi:hypothetical protein